MSYILSVSCKAEPGGPEQPIHNPQYNDHSTTYVILIFSFDDYK
jgi:hypothetical protein